jgi:hypothetical protein
MGCNCGKKKLSTQPKKIIKTPSHTVVTNGQNATRRFIRRASK